MSLLAACIAWLVWPIAVAPPPVPTTVAAEHASPAPATAEPAEFASFARDRAEAGPGDASSAIDLGGVVVRGRAIDAATRAPLASVTISADAGGWANRVAKVRVAATGNAIATMVTADDGRFAVRVPSVAWIEVQGRAPGRAPARLSVRGDTDVDVGDLALTAVRTHAVRIVDEADAPFGGARVFLFPAAATASGARTGFDGGFTSRLLDLDHPTAVADADGRIPLELADDAALELAIAHPQAAPTRHSGVELRDILAAAAPGAPAIVRLQRGVPATVRALVVGPRAPESLRVDVALRPLGITLSAIVDNGAEAGFGALVGELRVGARTARGRDAYADTTHDFTVSPRCELRLERPHTGAVDLFWDPSTMRDRELFVGLVGTYEQRDYLLSFERWPATAGHGTLYPTGTAAVGVIAFAPLLGVWRSPWFEPITDTELALAEWQRPGVAQRILVIGVDGRPCAGCRVDVDYGAGIGWPPTLQLLRNGTPVERAAYQPFADSALTAVDGTCTIVVPPNGPLRATASARGRGFVQAEAMPSPTPLRLQLAPTAQVHGSIASTRLADLAAARAVVRLTDRVDGAKLEQPVAVDGAFTFVGVPSATYDLQLLLLQGERFGRARRIVQPAALHTPVVLAAQALQVAAGAELGIVLTAADAALQPLLTVDLGAPVDGELQLFEFGAASGAELGSWRLPLRGESTIEALGVAAGTWLIVVTGRDRRSAFRFVDVDAVPLRCELVPLAPIDCEWELAGAGELRLVAARPGAARSSDRVTVAVTRRGARALAQAVPGAYLLQERSDGRWAELGTVTVGERGAVFASPPARVR